jgi:hypothetical protein
MKIMLYIGLILLGAIVGSSIGNFQIYVWLIIFYTLISGFILLLKNKKARVLETPEVSIASKEPDAFATAEDSKPSEAIEDSDTASLSGEMEQEEVLNIENNHLPGIDNSLGNVHSLPSVEANSARFLKSDWDYLIRNAQDGGTNSILASHVLKKTAQILEIGNLQAQEMRVQSEDVLMSAQEMLKFVTEIRSIAKSAKIVAFNLMMEASRQPSGSSSTIMVVAKEVALLSENTNKLTVNIEQSVANVSEVADNNQKKCAVVSNLFKQIDAELNQFKFIMARIEDLSISQCEKIRSFEQR